jgi:hypothetical protein
MPLPDRSTAREACIGAGRRVHIDRPDRRERPGARRPRGAGPSARGLFGLVALGAVLVLGCDRNIEPYRPGEEPRAPDLARIFPKPTAGERADDASGMADRAALPPSRTEGSGRAVAGAAGDGAGASGGGAEAATAGNARPISGRVELAPELAGARPAGAVLFVIARPQGARGGPPLAVLRIPEPAFPYEFEIGPADVMIPSMRFEGPISLTARLDADGNAMTRGESDLSSAPAEPLTPGTVGVALVLGQKG